MVGAREIEDALIRFDGRRVASLRLLVERGVSRDGIDTLIGALPGRHEIGASWMLKALGEKGALTGGDLAAVFLSLPALREADAILHVLQMVRMALSSRGSSGRISFLSPGMTGSW
jgi:phosphomannomutase